ncbi:MAG: tRNA preQ1(34) S-adenosylmethionine ribosyltransferase-isomerase QueA [Rhodothermales bacterium]|nr:tRNA preQ1(34) S-adenosylmethionine ribosyltransferase-isomerase QueA [Rhodothermales bacterium]
MSSVATAPRVFRPTLSLKLSDFDYQYPKELIAKYPAEPRDAARLLVVDRSRRAVEHRTFRDIVDYFNEGDVLVVNDTKVFPARLYGTKEKTGAKIEVFLLRELNRESRLWDVLVNPARKIRVGNKLYFDDDLVAEVVDNTTSRGRTIRFIFDGSAEDLYGLIERIGNTPIPPYIKRDADDDDKRRYQTMFAEKRGAVAAPTAGLHFTPAVIDGLKEKGVTVCPVTLHVGLGTFRPVEVEDLTKHRMDSENFEISDTVCDDVNRALNSAMNHVTVCGTTCVRALESSIAANGGLKSGHGWTDKFIFPPYEFRITERLITNFHMPKSTLLMLVSAFADRELIMHAYEEAIKEKYRLFSFGDAMIII